MKALIKEKKENVLTNLELMNMKNVSLLQSKELKRKTIKVEKKKLLEEKKEYQKESIALASIIGDGTKIKEEFTPIWCQEKTKGL